MIRYSDKVFTEICEELAEGKSLVEICKSKTMPNRSNVFLWMDKDVELYDRYVRARKKQGDYFFDEIGKIAVNVQKVEGIDPQRARVAIDALKWTAGRLNGRYSDKIKIEQKTELSVNSKVNELSKEELEKIVNNGTAQD